MFVVSIDIIVGGLLMGGIYALIAVGLSLQFGDGRVLNISHGEFIMVAAFLTWTLYTFLGISPLISLAICGSFLFVIGFFIHRSLFSVLPGPASRRSGAGRWTVQRGPPTRWSFI